MKSLRQFNNESRIDEVLITFGGRAYPKFGHIVILAGGAGSGKGFVVSRLLGIEGKVLDVDKLKKLAMASTKLSARVKRDTGKDISKLDLKNPDNVSLLHTLLASDDVKLDKRFRSGLFRSVLSAHPDRKPNLVFDVTAKDFKKVSSIAKYAEELGYDKKNVHIVWVVNDVEVAVDQNAGRDRVVPKDILMGTHKGASETMASILSGAAKIRKYLDGDIWLAFNKKGKDSDFRLVDKKTNKIFPNKDNDDDSFGSYLKSSAVHRVKKRGAGIDSSSVDKLMSKIAGYVPNPEEWEGK